MRTTVTLDDDLLREAARLTGIEEEVLSLIERERSGRGTGYVDPHLLASVSLTRDTKL